MDLYLLNLLNQFAGRWSILDNLAIFFADKFGYILIFGLALFLLKNRQNWLIATRALAAGILARYVITNIIRFVWERPRPFVESSVNLLSQHEANGSFPSGHAAFYFAIAAVVYFYNKKTGLLFFAGASLISLARVFAGVHWPSDILAGAAVGIFSGWLVARIFGRR